MVQVNCTVIGDALKEKGIMTVGTTIMVIPHFKFNS
jgi:hypothetical protein